MIKTDIEKILNQQLTRRQFLKSIGLGLLAIIGLPALVHILMPRTSNQNSLGDSGRGFGYGPYGS